MESLRNEIRYALRQILSSPAMAGVAVLSISLGIGLNTAMFSAVNALLLRPAPVQSPSELVALYSSHPDGIEYSTIISSLRGISDAHPTEGTRMGARNLLVIGRVSLSLVLLVGAALLLRSLGVAQAADLGFPVARLGMLTMHVEMNGYTEERGKEFYRELVERVRAMPEVEQAALTTRPPMFMNINVGALYPDGQASSDEEDAFDVDVTYVGGDYFRTLGVPIQQGRAITATDEESAPKVAVVNQTLAAQVWPQESAIGKRFRMRLDGDLYEVVGVSRDHKVRTVGEPDRPFVQFARAQHYNPYSLLVFRSRSDPRIAIERVRRILHSMDEDFVPFDAQTMEEVVATTLLPVRIGTSLLGAFSLLGVLLAAIGLYGLMAYWVSRRVREVGIRMALGAEKRRILFMVIGQGMRLVAIGAALGLGISIMGGRLLSAVLYVDPFDIVAFAAAAVVLVVVALVANGIPAWRAASVNPIVSLRQD